MSEAGLERLARTTGLECLWEDGMGSDTKTKTLIIAGSAVALDIVLSNNIVDQVSIAFPEAPDTVARHADKAAQILSRDLKLLPHESPLCKKLDKFAANLERLATLDRLSEIPKLNCYEAIAGIYESLNRLHVWDLEKLRQDPALAGKTQRHLEAAAVCTRHGRPYINERERIGLTLDYWAEMRLWPATTPKAEALAAKTEKTWGILISCAPRAGMVYPPVRVSDKWISAEIERANPTHDDILSASLSGGPILDWQEPENIILSENESTKTEPGSDPMRADASMSSGPKFPEVIFMATLDPPVIVPYSVWEQVHQLTGAPPSSEFSLATFDALTFPIQPGTNHDPSEPRYVRREKRVPFVGRGASAGGNGVFRTHENSLFIYKPVYGRVLTELPFSHPRQLVAMLPLLRQYAFLSTLLDASFGERSDSAPEPGDAHDKTTTTARDDYSAFMVHDATAKAPRELPLTIDVTLTAHPVPRLQVVFPFRRGTANILLEVRLNGEVHVVSQNILHVAGVNGDGTADGAEGPHGEAKGKGKQLGPQQLGRALEMFENIGKWCEWIRSRLG